MTMSWSDLPADLVAAIADRITKQAEFACFRFVCPSWRSASAANAARRRAPLLLLPSEYQYSARRRLWSLSEDGIAKILVPAARGFFLFASPNGWMLAVSHTVDHIFRGPVLLLHPFTGASAALPEVPRLFRCDLTALRDMAWDRSPHGAVMITLRDKERCSSSAAFFCRPGEGDGGSWSPMECLEKFDRFSVSGITYCDGAFYLFDGDTRRTVAVDSETFAVSAVIEPLSMTLITPPDERLRPCDWREAECTLVVSSADDFLVVVLMHPPGRSIGLLDLREDVLIKTFRWDCRRWTGVDDIGDRAVFVDSSRGFCVEANGVNGVRRNSVYVAGVGDDGRSTVYVLDLATGRTTECLSIGNLSDYRCGGFSQWPSWSMNP